MGVFPPPPPRPLPRMAPGCRRELRQLRASRGEVSAHARCLPTARRPDSALRLWVLAAPTWSCDVSCWHLLLEAVVPVTASPTAAFSLGSDYPDLLGS